MAETEKGKKIVYVHPYKREDGTPTSGRTAPLQAGGRDPSARPRALDAHDVERCEADPTSAAAPNHTENLQVGPTITPGARPPG
ncbi:MAG: hypothetical protein ACYDH5_17965 [Acidimicrobiales bacterium]